MPLIHPCLSFSQFRYHHYSLKRAYVYLVERRRIAAPNLSFFLQLIRYERELRADESIDDDPM